MGDKSKIQWTEATWNPVRGCTKVSPGCAHCYAESFSERFRGVPGHPYERGFDLRLVPDLLDLPMRWRRPRRVFVNSMSDLFHEDVPAEYIGRVWNIMGNASQHTFQVLTKRHERMRAIVEAYYAAVGCPPYRNVWLGVSVENQEFAKQRIPVLLQTAAAVRFISAEPLLGPIDLRFGRLRGTPREADMPTDLHRLGAEINWVIVGGESGPDARVCELDWIRGIVRQCRAAKVPVFVKQLGTFPRSITPKECLGGPGPYQKHGDPDEWPADLRVREYPAC